MTKLSIKKWSSGVIALVNLGGNLGLSLEDMGKAVDANPKTLQWWGWYTKSGKGTRIPKGYKRRLQVITDLSALISKESRKLNRLTP